MVVGRVTVTEHTYIHEKGMTKGHKYNGEWRSDMEHRITTKGHAQCRDRQLTYDRLSRSVMKQRNDVQRITQSDKESVHNPFCQSVTG